ncbi:MAG: CDP-alcohol phosphatidyltransferase family protein [Verrucomicrobiota bacterium]|nr:CDP-alcohol phosphatidyltransferase family protein [Verrucomicrobiota bacterium]
MSQPDLASTYRARDVEGAFDLFFYRKVGFQLARLFARFGLTPNAVTLLGSAIGILATRFYFYPELATNFIGMLLHVFCNAMDNADGQLARLTSRSSSIGKVLDGVCDHLVYISLYCFLALRLIAQGRPKSIWFLALAAALSHFLQSAVAEYCRDAYLRFVNGKRQALDLSSELHEREANVSWQGNFWKKLLLWLHWTYVVQQELLVPCFVRLEDATRRILSDEVPPWLQDEYRRRNRPLMKLAFLLRTNTRMLVLFTVLILGQPLYYFVIEVVALNLLLGFLLLRQNAICRQLQELVSQRVRA